MKPTSCYNFTLQKRRINKIICFPKKLWSVIKSLCWGTVRRKKATPHMRTLGFIIHYVMLIIFPIRPKKLREREISWVLPPIMSLFIISLSLCVSSVFAIHSSLCSFYSLSLFSAQISQFSLPFLHFHTSFTTPLINLLSRT